MKQGAWICVASICHVMLLVQGPCYECMIYDSQLKHDSLAFQDGSRLDKQGCSYECGCSPNPPNCKPGIPRVKDGCKCCEMCARQLGEPCSYRFVCDSSKQLLCQYFNTTQSRHSPKGFCKKAHGLNCLLNGKTYPDGTRFSTDCRHKCICLNGRISCTDICHSQEAFPPPEAVCPGAALFQPRGQCCKQWLCTRAHRQTLPVKIEPPLSGSLKQEQSHICTSAKRITTEWSPCNKFCGVGMSTRYTTDNLECKNITETRICHWRPCSMDDYRLGNSKCKPTIRAFRHIKLRFSLNMSDSSPSIYGSPPGNQALADRQAVCHSVRTFRPKFCSTCLANQCCVPEKTKTKNIQFVCDNGQTYFKNWEWVKKCVCRPGRCSSRQ